MCVNWNRFQNSDTLVKIRLGVYSIAFTHLFYIALKLLSVDFTKASDPRIWEVQNLKWKFITLWFNVLTLIYYPISIYCDWRWLTTKSNTDHVNQLNFLRTLGFTSVIFPVTVFSDTLFWRIWIKDRELLAPRTVDELVPCWTQHSMHTVSLVLVIIDLFIMPRRRPASQKLGSSILATFVGTYLTVCCIDYIRGIYVYPFFKLFNGFDCFLFLLYVFVENFFYFSAQWVVTDLLWGREKPTNEESKVSTYQDKVDTCSRVEKRDGRWALIPNCKN